MIEANNNSKENLYIQSATLNGRVLDKNFIRYVDIADGGIIRLKWEVNRIKNDVRRSMPLPSLYRKNKKLKRYKKNTV